MVCPRASILYVDSGRTLLQSDVPAGPYALSRVFPAAVECLMFVLFGSLSSEAR